MVRIDRPEARNAMTVAMYNAAVDTPEILGAGPHARTMFKDQTAVSEVAEGFAAFLSKRPPSWSPRARSESAGRAEQEVER